MMILAKTNNARAKISGIYANSEAVVVETESISAAHLAFFLELALLLMSWIIVCATLWFHCWAELI